MFAPILGSLECPLFPPHCSQREALPSLTGRARPSSRLLAGSRLGLAHPTVSFLLSVRTLSSPESYLGAKCLELRILW